jgi:hypothetical protein
MEKVGVATFQTGGVCAFGELGAASRWADKCHDWIDPAGPGISRCSQPGSASDSGRLSRFASGQFAQQLVPVVQYLVVPIVALNHALAGTHLLA